MITAGVPPMKKVGNKQAKTNSCYAEADVQALMVLNHCSRAEAVAVLDLACEVAADGIQLLGGNGYMADYHQEKRFRDAVQAQSFLGMQDMKRQEYAGLLVRDGLPR